MHYVIALVYAWLLEHPEEYCAWVSPYTQLRYCAAARHNVAVRVGGQAAEKNRPPSGLGGQFFPPPTVGFCYL